MGQYWTPATSDDARGENIFGRVVRGSWWPFHCSIQPVWHLASGMRWCSIVLEVKPKSYSEWVYIRVLLQQAIQQLEVSSGAHCPYSQQYWSLDSLAMYSAPHGCFGVSLVVGVSSVTCGMLCTQYPVLRRFAYPFKVETRRIAKHNIH